MLTRKPWNLLFVTTALALLSSCAGITLKDQSVCTVAGVMAAGMNCAHTLEGDPYEMDLQETIKFLEPNEEENRSGAMCMSADDFNTMKTTIDIACKKMGSACTVEVKQKIAQVKKNLDALNMSVPKLKEEPMNTISAIPVKGQSGQDVVVVQNQLKARGFDPGTIDGIFGAKTEKAIQGFQKSMGLPGSGIMGPKTIQFLNIEIKVVAPVTGKDAITKDLKGRKARYLHPTLRLLLEAKAFPGGEIPQCFKDEDIAACVVHVAKAMESLKIREEGGNNRGKMVGMIQAIIGSYASNGTGDAWCMSTDQCIIAFIEDYFQVESPIVDSEHCVTTHNAAKKVAGLIASKCAAGTFWIAQHGTTTSGHTGTVLKANANNTMDTFEGNTGDSSMRDGDGAYFRTRNQVKNGDLKTLSFVYLYPNNKLPKAA